MAEAEVFKLVFFQADIKLLLPGHLLWTDDSQDRERTNHFHPLLLHSHYPLSGSLQQRSSELHHCPNNHQHRPPPCSSVRGELQSTINYSQCYLHFLAAAI